MFSPTANLDVSFPEAARTGLDMYDKFSSAWNSYMNMENQATSSAEAYTTTTDGVNGVIFACLAGNGDIIIMPASGTGAKIHNVYTRVTSTYTLAASSGENIIWHPKTNRWIYTTGTTIRTIQVDSTATVTDHTPATLYGITTFGTATMLGDFIYYFPRLPNVNANSTIIKYDIINNDSVTLAAGLIGSLGNNEFYASALGPNGKIYATRSTNATTPVYAFDPITETVSTFGGIPQYQPLRMLPARDGRIIIPSHGNTTTGYIINTIDDTLTTFSIPSNSGTWWNVCHGPDGNIWWCRGQANSSAGWYFFDVNDNTVKRSQFDGVTRPSSGDRGWHHTEYIPAKGDSGAGQFVAIAGVNNSSRIEYTNINSVWNDTVSVPAVAGPFLRASSTK